MELISQYLEDYMLTEQGVVPAGEMDKRIAALREMFRGARHMNATQFQEAMTTAHFSYYFADALSRMFYQDYEYQRGAWPLYTRPDTVPDFRDVDRYRMTEPGTLKQRREKGETRMTYVADSLIQYGVDEFSRGFDISWQTLMNDDLGKLRETPQRMANAASRFEDEWVSALYDNATTQATLAGLGAPWAGTGRLTEPNLTIGVNAMMQRTDAGGNRIQIRGIHLVIPPVLAIQAAKILESLNVAGSADNDKNVVARYIRGVHVDPFIGFSGANIPWYLFADPAEIPTVTVARLNGWPGPITYMERSNIQMIAGQAPAQFMLGNAQTGDITYYVQDVIGGWDDASYVGVTDYRGLYYSSGTTA